MIATQVLKLSTLKPIPSESDTQLACDVTISLRNTGYMQLHQLDVEVADHDVCLRGRVPSYYLKQIAHFAALAVPGIRSLTDGIAVAN